MTITWGYQSRAMELDLAQGASHPNGIRAALVLQAQAVALLSGGQIVERTLGTDVNGVVTLGPEVGPASTARQMARIWECLAIGAGGANWQEKLAEEWPRAARAGGDPTGQAVLFQQIKPEVGWQTFAVAVAGGVAVVALVAKYSAAAYLAAHATDAVHDYFRHRADAAHVFDRQTEVARRVDELRRQAAATGQKFELPEDLKAEIASVSKQAEKLIGDAKEIGQGVIGFPLPWIVGGAVVILGGVALSLMRSKKA